MVKTKIVANLSLRAKFKGSSIVEVVVMNHKTNEVYALHWNFRTDEVTESFDPAEPITEEDLEQMENSASSDKEGE